MGSAWFWDVAEGIDIDCYSIHDFELVVSTIDHCLVLEKRLEISSPYLLGFHSDFPEQETSNRLEPFKSDSLVACSMLRIYRDSSFNIQYIRWSLNLRVCAIINHYRNWKLQISRWAMNMHIFDVEYTALMCKWRHTHTGAQTAASYCNVGCTM